MLEELSNSGMFHQISLAETNSSHLKIGRLRKEETIVFQPSIFRGELLVLRSVYFLFHLQHMEKHHVQKWWVWLVAINKIHEQHSTLLWHSMKSWLGNRHPSIGLLPSLNSQGLWSQLTCSNVMRNKLFIFEKTNVYKYSIFRYTVHMWKKTWYVW